MGSEGDVAWKGRQSRCPGRSRAYALLADHPRPAASPHPAGATGPASAISPAVVARIRQLAAQAEHRRAVAEFRARRAAGQQARINALLLEAINALARLLSEPDHPANRPG